MISVTLIRFLIKRPRITRLKSIKAWAPYLRWWELLEPFLCDAYSRSKAITYSTVLIFWHVEQCLPCHRAKRRWGRRIQRMNIAHLLLTQVQHYFARWWNGGYEGNTLITIVSIRKLCNCDPLMSRTTIGIAIFTRHA